VPPVADLDLDVDDDRSVSNCAPRATIVPCASASIESPSNTTSSWPPTTLQ
jgi:hypothetical protein